MLDSFQERRKLLELDRLGQEEIDPADESLALCLGRPQPGERDYRGRLDAVVLLEGADLSSRLEAVHDRHGDVHEHDSGFHVAVAEVVAVVVIYTRAAGENGGLVGFQRLETVGCCEFAMALLLGIDDEELKVDGLQVLLDNLLRSLARDVRCHPRAINMALTGRWEEPDSALLFSAAQIASRKEPSPRVLD